MKLENLLALLVLVLSVLFLTGCGTLNLYQKLYRDGTFDISLEAKSDNAMFLNLVKQSFEGSPGFEGATYMATDDGFKYTKEKVSFSPQLSSNGSIMNKFGIKKEFKFPYYVYTITLDNNITENEESGATAGLINVNYIIEPFGKIVDTNGIFVGEDKKAVQFNLLKSNKYYVVFKDFMIASWLGGASKIVNREPLPAQISIPETDLSTLSGQGQETAEPTESYEEMMKREQEEERLAAEKLEKDFLAKAATINSTKKIDNYIEVTIHRIGLVQIKDLGEEKEFLRVDLTVNNIGYQSLSYYDSNAIVIAKDGTQYKQERLYSIDNLFEWETIYPKAKQTGSIYINTLGQQNLDLDWLIIDTGLTMWNKEANEIIIGKDAQYYGDTFVFKFDIANITLTR